MTDREKRDFLVDRGWDTWYNDNYWIHPKTVVNEDTQDHTNYGLSLDDAYRFETEEWKPFEPAIIPIGRQGAFISRAIRYQTASGEPEID